MEENNTFEILNSINVNNMVEKKQAGGGTTLTYLSWASAYQVAKANFPDLEYEIERNPETGLPYWYDPLTGYMVFTKVTINGQTHEMWLPVMDATNHAMKDKPYEVKTKYKTYTVPAATMTDVNKACMRCLVKNLSMFGLALYIYKGEDIPQPVEQHSAPIQPVQPANKPVEKVQPQTTAQKPAQVRDTRPVTVDEIKTIKRTLNEYGIDEEFICSKYRVQNLGDLQMYQFTHMAHNISKLKAMYENEKQQRLIDMVKNTKPAKMETTFGDAICQPQQPQEKTEGEPIDLESLGLSPADLDALTECGNVFN